MKACDSVISYAKEKYGETLKMKDFYMGISDMCYTGLDKDMNFDNLFKNLAGIGSVYNFPAEDMKSSEFRELSSVDMVKISINILKDCIKNTTLRFFLTFISG